MNFLFVTPHLPLPEGTAAGRLLLATCLGLRAAGHDVRVWSWHHREPDRELPPWCEWRPVPGASAVVRHGRAVLHPRHDVLRASWDVPDDVVLVADEANSFPAVRHRRFVALTVHHLRRLDVRALGRAVPADLQEMRAERRAARAAPLLLAGSTRVARASGARDARFVPVGFPLAPTVLPPGDEPVAATLADWTWPPNRWSLARLLEAWPDVRARVPSARLRLGGRGLDGVGSLAGVEVLGRVDHAADVLAEAAVVAFPAPPTSGPKVKVLEALAVGRPAVTTPAGVEGLVVPDGAGAVVGSIAQFADLLADTLLDPERRVLLAASGRAAIEAHHAPGAVAAAVADACQSVFGAALPITGDD